VGVWRGRLLRGLLVLGEEQLGGRHFRAQRAMLALGSHIQRSRRCSAGAVWGSGLGHFCCEGQLWCTRAMAQLIPSGSLPTTELLPLHEWPLVLAYMAEPMLYSEEKESRFSAASTSDRDLASDKEDG
jgi:hypothetical protein